MNDTLYLNIPIIFKVNENKYDDFIDKIKKIGDLHDDTKAQLGLIKARRIYPQYKRVTQNKEKTIDKIKSYLNKNKEEIMIGRLYKLINKGLVSYKTFQRIIAELAFNKEIITRKSSGTTGNTTYIKMKGTK